MTVTTSYNWAPVFTGGTFPPGVQNGVTVTALAGGGYFAAFFNSNGADVNGETRNNDGSVVRGFGAVLNSTTAASQFEPSTVQLKNGNVVVAYTDTSVDGPSAGTETVVRLVIINPVTHARVGLEATPEMDDLRQFNPHVAALDDGGFVVTYLKSGFVGTPGGLDYEGITDVIAAVYNANGSLRQYVVVNGGNSDARDHSVAAIAGGFVVVWVEGRFTDSPDTRPYLERYTSAGVRTSSERVQISNDLPTDIEVLGLTDGGYAIAYARNGVTTLNIYNANGSNRALMITVDDRNAGAAEDRVALAQLANGMIAVSFQEGAGAFVQAFSPIGDRIGATRSTISSGVAGGDIAGLSNGSIAFAYNATTGVFAPNVASHVLALRRTSVGDDAADVIVGDILVDFITGGGGDDVLTGGGGDDVIDGGAASDTAVFGLALGAAAFIYVGSDLIVGSAEGNDTLRGVEQLQFTGGVTVPTATLRVVELAYQALFNRGAVQSELSFWLNHVRGGGDQGDVVAALVNSSGAAAAEGRALIAQYYTTYLGRSPSADEANVWSGLLAGGATSLQQAQAVFAGQTGAAARESAFIGGLYQTWLGRPAAANEIAVWKGLFAAVEYAPSDLRTVLIDAGRPFINLQTEALYQTWFGRASSANDQNVWFSLYRDSGAEFSSLRSALIADDAGRAQTRAVTINKYQDFFGRAPNQNEIDVWYGLFRDGAEYRDLRNALVYEPAGIARINSVVAEGYQTYFGRAPTQAESDYWLGAIQGGVEYGQFRAVLDANNAPTMASETVDVWSGEGEDAGDEGGLAGEGVVAEAWDAGGWAWAPPEPGHMIVMPGDGGWLL